MCVPNQRLFDYFLHFHHPVSFSPAPRNIGARWVGWVATFWKPEVDSTIHKPSVPRGLFELLAGFGAVPQTEKMVNHFFSPSIARVQCDTNIQRRQTKADRCTLFAFGQARYAVPLLAEGPELQDFGADGMRWPRKAAKTEPVGLSSFVVYTWSYVSAF